MSHEANGPAFHLVDAPDVEVTALLPLDTFTSPRR